MRRIATLCKESFVTGPTNEYDSNRFLYISSMCDCNGTHSWFICEVPEIDFLLVGPESDF